MNPSHDNSKDNRALWVLLIAGCLLIAAGGFAYYGQQKNTNANQTEPKQSTNAASTPSDDQPFFASLKEAVFRQPESSGDLPNDLLQQARAGDAQAQFIAGRTFMHRNQWDKAVPWFELAAAQNHPKAQGNLGIAYLYGLGGVAKNAAKACELMELSNAQLQTVESLENAALCHDTELGNHAKAFEYYLQAAHLGGVPAMRFVGQMYHSGEGVAQNDALAVYWLRQAALKNDARALYSLGLKYTRHEGIPNTGTDNHIAAYFLFKAAQAKRTADDNDVFKQVDFENNLRQLEAKMPPESLPLRKLLEQMLQANDVKRLIESIDKYIPYTPPADIPQPTPTQPSS